MEDYLLNRRSSLAVGILRPALGLPAHPQLHQGTLSPKWQATVHVHDSGMDFDFIMSISAMEVSVG